MHPTHIPLGLFLLTNLAKMLFKHPVIIDSSEIYMDPKISGPFLAVQVLTLALIHKQKMRIFRNRHRTCRMNEGGGVIFFKFGHGLKPFFLDQITDLFL